MSPVRLPTFRDVLVELARALDDAGVRYYLFGAQAAILHGVTRTSADIDVTVEAGATTEVLLPALARAGFDAVSDR